MQSSCAGDRRHHPCQPEREGPRIVFGWMQPLPTWETFAAREPLLAALGVDASLLPVERYDLGFEPRLRRAGVA